MKIETVLITPKLASELLERNTHNRVLRNGYVNFLASEMEAGRWRDYTGDTIRIATDKSILDGQHRLHAVVLSGFSIKTHIAYDVDVNAMDVIDTGMRRQSSDTLFLSGVKRSTIVAAVIKFVKGNGLEAGMIHNGSFASNREVREIYNNDPIFWDNVSEKAQRWYNEFKPISVKLFGGCFALALKQSKSPQRVIKFFEILATGVGEDCAIILQLRKKFINNQSQTGRRYTAAARRDLIQSHFNGWMKGQKYAYSNPEGKWL